MGKASKWFRGLIALINNNNNNNSPSLKKAPNKDNKQCRCWRSHRDSTTNKKDFHFLHHTTPSTSPQQLHVQFNSSSVHVEGATPRAIVGQEWAAAVKIQAAFRGCLARRALGALKGIVMLQALVRGDIHRRRTAALLQRMQSFLRAQARAHAVCSQIPQASYLTAKPSTGHLFHGPATPEKFESRIRSVSMKYDRSKSVLKRNGSKSRVHINGNQDKRGNRSNTNRAEEQSLNRRRSCSMDDKSSVKILEIDSGKPHISSKHRNLFYSTSQPLVWEHYSQSLTTTKDSASYQSCQSVSSCEVQSYSPLKLNEVEDNSPQIFSNSSKDGGSRKSPFTPTMSDGSRSYLSGYSNYPSYMAYTESSKAKVRSISAPKQRLGYERSSSVNSYLLQ